MTKIKVAITGNIGSGKSTFTEYLSSKGYPVIDADSISKGLLASDKIIIQKVIKQFGERAYKNGKVNKKYLAETVFTDQSKLKTLNSILHLQVIKKINNLVKNEFINEKIIFIESALIYEADIEKNFDYVVLVTSEFNKRLKRMVDTGKISKEDFIKRDNNQIPEKEKEKRADYIFTNDGNKKDLIKKVDLLLLTLKVL